MVTLKIEQYADTEDYYIQIPEDILNTLQWKEGDELVWEVQSDNSISVRKDVASLSTKKTSSKSTSKKPSVKSSTRQKLKDRGVKHTRSSKIELFPVNSMPWRLEPRTGKFNLSWYMCFDQRRRSDRKVQS